MLLVLAAGFFAGLVRGFGGFGATLTFVPIVSGVIPPAEAIVMISLVDSATGLLLVPGAAKLAQHRRILTMALAASLTVPLGAWMLATLETTLIRWILCLLILLSVLALASGWRYRRTPGFGATVGIGGLSGFMGGIGGFFGPAAMVFLMGSDGPAAQHRANAIMFIAWMLIAAAISYVALGLFRLEQVWQALPLAPAFALGVWIGGRGFRQASDRQYQSLVYGIIALAAICGLPILDPYLR